MFRLLYALGVLLIGWGGYVLYTGDFVATQDIAAGLVGTGIAVIALGAVVAALDRIARQLGDRPPISVNVPAPMMAEPVGRAPVESGQPSLVREGVVEGRRYRFYSDGSIDAEGPQGLRRYRSMEEAREDILRARPEAPRGKTAERSPASRPGSSWENHLPPGRDDRGASRYAPPPRDAVRGDPQDDEEWSEPFRMLLKGEPDPVDPGKR